MTLRRDGVPSALLLGENCMRQEIDYILPPALRGEIPGGGEESGCWRLCIGRIGCT